MSARRLDAAYDHEPDGVGDIDEDVAAPNGDAEPRPLADNDVEQPVADWLRFLKELAPNGPWRLTAINPERNNDIETITATDIRAAENFVAHYNDTRNIYYALNPLRGIKNRKAAKTDVASVDFAHADLDPRDDETPDAAKSRYLAALEPWRPHLLALVDSGNGVQAIGRLPASERIVLGEPVQVTDKEGRPVKGRFVLSKEDKAKVDAFEARLEAWMIELGSKTGTQNVDRVLRLPGTENLPNATKRKRGRQRCLSHLIELNEGATFSLDKLPLPEPKPTPRAKPSGVSAFQRINDEALANLPAWVPKLFPGAKETNAGYRVTSAMLGRDNEEDLSITPDGIKDFGVHDLDDPLEGKRTPIQLVLEWHFKVPVDVIASKKVEHDKIKEAAQFLWTALGHEGAWHDELDELVKLNKDYAVVVIGSEARVLTWEESLVRPGCRVPRYLTPGTFKFVQDKFRVECTDGDGNKRRVPRGSWWLGHPGRRQYESVVFVPGKETPGKLNLWHGWACEPRPGDCGLYLEHLRNNICSNNETYYQYALDWMANAVRHPDRQGEVAFVLRGGEGTGKGFFVKRFGWLFGPHFLHVANARHLTGNFNVHLQQCCVLFGDEAFYAGDRQHEGVLKVLVTEESLTIEPKGVDIFVVPNFLHVILSSNNDWVVPASFDARRWFVLDVSDAKKQDTAYFGAIDAQMQAGGQEALLHLLMNRDLSKFDVRDVPKTEALAKQKEMTRRGIDRVVEKAAHEGVLPCVHSEFHDVAITSGEGEGRGFYSAARQVAPDLKYVSSVTMARTLREEWGCETWRSHGLNGVRFPDVGRLRELFDEKFGPQAWDEGTKAWEGPPPRSLTRAPITVVTGNCPSRRVPWGDSITRSSALAGDPHPAHPIRTR